MCSSGRAPCGPPWTACGHSSTRRLYGASSILGSTMWATGSRSRQCRLSSRGAQAFRPSSASWGQASGVTWGPRPWQSSSSKKQSEQDGQRGRSGECRQHGSEKEPSVSIHIVTDSTSYLPGGYADQHGIDVVPLRVTIDGVLYREFVDIASDQFYVRQKSGAKAVTSQPGPEDFVGLYKRLLQNPEDEVLSIHISSLMSGTLNSAHAAAAMIESQQVVLYDSRMSGLGLGFMVMEAAHLAETGAAVSDIVAALDAMQARIHIYFLVGTLEYLVAGARIGKAAGVAGSILQIKPILTIKDGMIDVYDRPRTMRVAREHLWVLIDDAVGHGVEYVGFHYAGNRAEVEALQQEFERRTGIPSILSQLGPVVGGNTGPETLGVVIVEKAV
ncbi:DegV family protein [Candidatus Cryosericum terrychapinii]|uniref:DegV family protein n=1 Tax=Candidatus Cryosericum terrychapinii TaxID=2290919 RepID=A0A398CZJ5_9BACT|nr:DegV family protein [Candidatus Cryosericum terrychapinii]